MLLKFLPIWLVYFLAAASPGPSQVFVVENSSLGSVRRGRLSALGISLGTAVWVLLVAFGLGAFVNTFAYGAIFLRVLSIALLSYFIFRNIKSVWLQARTGVVAHKVQTQVAPESAARLVTKGLLVNLVNPNSVAFFLSLFAPLLLATQNLHELAVCVAGVIVISLVWYQVLVALATQHHIQKLLQKSATAMRVIFALIYFYFLVKLVRAI